MQADFEGWLGQPASPVPEALAALRAVTAVSTAEPLVLGVAPVARGNPFQALLYRQFPRHGIAVTPVTNPHNFTRLGELGPVRTALHLHWLSFVLAEATSRAQARARLKRFAGQLSSYRDSGGQVVWTIHNVLPHDAQFPEEEIALRNLVAQAASAVHVMTPASIAAVAHTVELDPAKVIHVPHPSYLGAYPDIATRQDARLALGIEPDELVFVLFGAIKPYKGLGRLLDAFDAARHQSGRAMRLLVAGQADDSEQAREFVQRALVHPFVLIRPVKVVDEHVQYFLRAADVGLAPYTRVLNSGAAMLYTSFGLPSVIPGEPAIQQSLPAAARVAFGSDAELPSALLAAAELATNPGSAPAVSAALAAHAEAHASTVVSADFAQQVRARLLGTGAAGR